jgi:hypothetical protein
MTDWHPDLSTRPPPCAESIKIDGPDAEVYGVSVNCDVELSDGIQHIGCLDYPHSEWVDAESMGGYLLPVVRWRIRAWAGA